MAVRMKKPRTARPSLATARPTLPARPSAARRGAAPVAAARTRAVAASPATSSANTRVRAMASTTPSPASGRTLRNTGGDGGSGGTNNKAAIKRVRKLAKRNDRTLTKEQAAAKVERLTTRDRDEGAAYKFDYAGDGAFYKDKDFGTKKNNQRRKEKGKERRNVKGDKKYGTGKKFKNGNGDGGNSGGGGNGGGGGSDIPDPHPNNNQDGDPNNGSNPPVDLSPQSQSATRQSRATRGAGPPGSPGSLRAEERAALARRRRNNKRK